MQQQEDQEGEAQQAVSASTSSSICSLQPLEAAASTAAAVKSVAAGAEAEERRQEAVRTFCVERRARGGTYYRTFTAASYPAVWQLFRHTAPKDLHWYEVIREGRPAHLYFDLEFVPRLNPQVDGEALVDVLLQHVAAQLRRHFDLILDPRFVYELDSSTPNKFSRHLTLRLPGHAFSNNHAMGKFVAQVLAASDSKLLVVRKEQEPGGGGGGPQLGSMVDMAVYSKNRHWRMSRCCKGGKEAVLHPTGRYATAPGAGVSDATVFLDTLVCNVEPHARLLQMPDPLPTAGPNNRGGVGMLGAAALQSGIGGLGSCGLQVTWKQGAIDTALLPDQVAELRRLAEEAVSFIEKVATQRAGAPARARTLAFCGGGAKVAYSMIGPGSHYCENIGRPHTSNHVFFVADFLGGTYTQKCHDPDCAHFRSAWMPLTAELCRLATGAAALPPPSPSASGRSAGTRG
ncbi:hypothetical protein CHLNCDRAFT_135708 [Chlorella variabilis]|uniref:DNA-directed primase/polymerase protein n=1 Tax=Chlorella variabilis TaxID=554065 RepID=E1ZIU4_CHLVA|nr:hypothetical protein CHLNCDRAFT_135708 [Chlorella variabilis]EFN54394.1 hypothetical protein CHLNCDRAFT_135708 [Chlorella variabilis]|eukprot:XP_005846496.1 hypothetical protein CHLNCDRAFT_135708 [Chlorella variabilis]